MARSYIFLTIILLANSCCSRKPTSVDIDEESRILRQTASYSHNATDTWQALNTKSLDYEYRKLYNDAIRITSLSIRYADSGQRLAMTYFNLGYLSELAGQNGAAK